MRQLVGELMDDPTLDRDEHLHALSGLARINTLSFASAALYGEVRRLSGGKPVHAVDLATGSGDVPIAMLRRAKKDGFDLSITATDISAVALERAEVDAERAGVGLATRRLDLLKDSLPAGDVLTCSLFLHHLEKDDARALFEKVREGSHRALVVSDLRRCAWGRLLATTTPRLLTRSRVVHVDAALSERAAFTPGELLGLMEDAGLKGARVRNTFPARMLLTWERG